MTRTTNARVAGFTFLFYIVVGVASMVVFGRATGGADVEARLVAMAQHAADVRLSVLLTLLQGFSALVLAVTLHALTREQDSDLAMLGLTCRVVEGVTGVFVARTLGLVWLATSGGAAASDPAAARALAAFLFKMGAWNPGAIFFAVGSTLFCWLFLRGRLIPTPLAWLGVFASVLLVLVLPIDLIGAVPATISGLVWLPMLTFEVPLGFWLIVKGVDARA